MLEAPAVLIAATSARALATSARRAGYAPLVVDFFADDDTREEAERCLKFDGCLATGFQLAALVEACERLAGSRTIVGFVYGAGFEDRPALLEAAARRWRLLGNSAETVSRLKDPIFFADYCQSNAIPHPEIALARPAHPSGWLARQRGGSGGGHIKPCEEVSSSDARTYYQRKASGRPVSALILADGARCSILGFSEQWSAPQEGRPFRFAGAARPAAIVPAVEQALESIAQRICCTIPLIGLNSLDFLVFESGFWLLEINPRPGATLDLFEAESGRDSLFALHVAACQGELKPTPRQDGACAFEILYADFEIARTPALNWPAWTRDRQPEGSFVAKGDPFCTIVARGATTSDVRRDLTERAATIRLSIQRQVA